MRRRTLVLAATREAAWSYAEDHGLGRPEHDWFHVRGWETLRGRTGPRWELHEVPGWERRRDAGEIADALRAWRWSRAGATVIVRGDPGPHDGCVHDPAARWVPVAGPGLDPRRAGADAGSGDGGYGG